MTDAAAEKSDRWWTPASAVAFARLAVAAALLVLAFLGLPQAYAALLAAALLTDAFDGVFARWKGRSSPWSARLDGWADVATGAGLPLAAHWLRPDLIHGEALAFWAILLAAVGPAVHGFIKYGSVIAPRTRRSTLALYLVGAALIILVSGGPTWPLRVAAAALFAAALEEMAINAILALPIAARSAAHALRLRREQGDDDEE